MKKVLLIEDDKTLRENTREILELESYEVQVASNGKEGLESIFRDPPNIIVCDILMPIMDGYEVFKALRHNKHFDKIPFVFLSARAEIEDIRKGMNLGVDDYITKPFKEEDLLNTIKSRLARYQLLSENETGGDEPVLTDLEELRNYFIQKGEFFKVFKNEIIYKERKNASFVYYVEKGLVKTHRMDEYGKELITSISKKNDFFGFYYFRNLSQYPETATALQATNLYRLSSLNFQELLQQNHRLTLDLAQMLSDKLSALKTNLLEMAYASVLKKTTNTILQFAEIMKDNAQEGIRISRTDLASVAGISTESFIRSLSSLKKEGLIDIEGRNIKILDLQKLHSIK